MTRGIEPVESSHASDSPSRRASCTQVGERSSIGARLGEAYQVADDLRDTLDDESTLGKPAGQDMAHDRPNACLTLGIEGALERLRSLLDQALEATPSCVEPARVIDWVEGFGARLYPRAVRVPLAASASVTDLRA
jgi:geranylgeranyl diphosphate synthase type II